MSSGSLDVARLLIFAASAFWPHRLSLKLQFYYVVKEYGCWHRESYISTTESNKWEKMTYILRVYCKAQREIE